TRDTNEGDSVHVINIDIQDNHEEAAIGALFVCDLCAKSSDNLDFLLNLDNFYIFECSDNCMQNLLFVMIECLILEA
ncbi:unnamed protein product, partial [Brugia timori]|uniref:RNA polymerase II subunit A C-terminal domain phosphatase SSU72 n=1 Tax=Brugia timori TaxID=42155 RepID=A0A0R3QBF7_9BILA